MDNNLIHDAAQAFCDANGYQYLRFHWEPRFVSPKMEVVGTFTGPEVCSVTYDVRYNKRVMAVRLQGTLFIGSAAVIWRYVPVGSPDPLRLEFPSVEAALAYAVMQEGT